MEQYICVLKVWVRHKDFFGFKIRSVASDTKTRYRLLLVVPILRHNTPVDPDYTT